MKRFTKVCLLVMLIAAVPGGILFGTARTRGFSWEVLRSSNSGFYQLGPMDVQFGRAGFRILSHREGRIPAGYKTDAKEHSFDPEKIKNLVIDAGSLGDVEIKNGTGDQIHHGEGYPVVSLECGSGDLALQVQKP